MKKKQTKTKKEKKKVRKKKEKKNSQNYLFKLLLFSKTKTHLISRSKDFLMFLNEEF